MDKSNEFKYMITLEKDHVTYYVIDAIKALHKKRVEIIKYGKMLGCDIYEVMITSIDENDIISFGTCLKYVEFDNNKIENMSMLHYCTIKKRYPMIRSLVLKGVDVNLKDADNISAFELALCNYDYDCINELVMAGADVNITIKYEDNIISVIGVILHEYDIKRRNILELIISKIKSLDDDVIEFMIKLINKNFINEIDIILSRFPEFINKKYNEMTIFSYMIEVKHTFLINKYILLPSTKLNIKNKIPYLHLLSRKCYLDHVTYIIEKYPKSIYKLCDEKRTAIDHVLISWEENDINESYNIIKYLINKGCNIDNINIYDCSTIFTAIQYTNTNIVELLIDSGININININNINKINHDYPILNLDYVGFASQMGKNDMIDMLLKKGSKINFYDGIPTCLLLAIKNNHNSTVKFLLNYTESKKYINDDFIKKIGEYAINNGISDKNILMNFMSDDMVDQIHKNALKIKILNFDKKIKILYTEYGNYRHDKESLLITFHYVLNFLKFCEI